VARVSVRVRELIVQINTKTKDNVFVDLELAVQYQVGKREDVWAAYYTLTDHEQQMESFIYDTVRAKVPTMELDNVFENKDDIADDVKATLAEQMQAYGYTIVQSLVNDVRPAANVATAMNEIVAQERLRRAAEHRAQAEYIQVVKAAEADAESRRLSGEGIAPASRDRAGLSGVGGWAPAGDRRGRPRDHGRRVDDAVLRRATRHGGEQPLVRHLLQPRAGRDPERAAAVHGRTDRRSEHRQAPASESPGSAETGIYSSGR
jgi:regulator of protease activity HflC (stomatin/prohibitin superfamily)